MSDFHTLKEVPEERDASFSKDEHSTFQRVRTLVEADVAGLDAAFAHRMFLGCASELVDAAADLAAEHRPGMRVVELGLLAERLSVLAVDYQNADEPDVPPNASSQ